MYRTERRVEASPSSFALKLGLGRLEKSLQVGSESEVMTDLDLQSTLHPNLKGPLEVGGDASDTVLVRSFAPPLPPKAACSPDPGCCALYAGFVPRTGH